MPSPRQDLHCDIKELVEEPMPPDKFVAAFAAFSQLSESRIDQSHGSPGLDQSIASNVPLDTTPALRRPAERVAFNATITLMAKTDEFSFCCEKKHFGWEVSARLPLVINETTAKNQATELAKRLGIPDPLIWEPCLN